jgi:hypothetical protein
MTADLPGSVVFVLTYKNDIVMCIVCRDDTILVQELRYAQHVDKSDSVSAIFPIYFI